MSSRYSWTVEHTDRGWILEYSQWGEHYRVTRLPLEASDQREAILEARKILNLETLDK
jgi:hypothetical protein